MAEHVARSRSGSGSVAWDDVLASYDAVRPEHCRRVLTNAREWGILWHHRGAKRLQRNEIMRARDVRDYSFVDWIYGPTALTPDEEPAMFQPIPLATAPAPASTIA